MEDRLRRAEKIIHSLSAALHQLEARLGRLEQAYLSESVEPILPPTGDPTDAVHEGLTVAGGTVLVTTLSVIGRTFLVLAGAFLLRTLTDAEIIPHTTGVALGLAYAAVWIVFADRAGAKAMTLSASFYGVAAVLIAYPLVWESTTKLRVLSTETATALITSATGIFFLVAWRRRIYPLAWAVTLATLITCTALIFTTTAMEYFTAPILFLGAITVWTSYSRPWKIMRWLAAFSADICILQMVYLATRSGESPGRFGHLSMPAVQILAVSLLLLYLGSFALNTLVRRHDVTAFEVLQSAGALLVGFGGAVHIAREAGAGSLALGVAAITAAGMCYAVAFTFVDRRLGRGRNFFFYAWLALVLSFLGSWLLLPEVLLSIGWTALAVAAAFLGGHYDRITLRVHCAVYSTAAAWQSGLITAGIMAFTTPSVQPWSTPGILMLAVTIFCYALLVMTQRGREVRWSERLPRFILLILSVLGVGGLAVLIIFQLLSGSGDADPTVAAVIRSAVLAGSAIALATLGPRRQLVEMSWLVYPVLLAGGIKLLIEDLHRGQPLTIFLGFAFYGIALIAAPRLLRNARSKDR